MATPWMTALMCSLITAMAAGVLLKQYSIYKRDRTDRRSYRNIIVMLCMLIMFSVATAYAYLSSFGII